MARPKKQLCVIVRTYRDTVHRLGSFGCINTKCHRNNTAQGFKPTKKSKIGPDRTFWFGLGIMALFDRSTYFSGHNLAPKKGHVLVDKIPPWGALINFRAYLDILVPK